MNKRTGKPARKKQPAKPKAKRFPLGKKLRVKAVKISRTGEVQIWK